HAAETIYENIALRVMGDLDLMVPKEDALRAFEWVQTLGYRPSTKGNNDAGLNLDRYHHLFQLCREGSFPVELHWTIHHSQRPPILPVEELWKRAEAIRFGQVKLLGLSLEDLLLHIAWHPSGHHLFEADLRPLCDIDWMLSRTTSSRIQWPVLRETAQRWGWSRGIFLTLRIAHELFHTPIPAAIEKEVAAVPGDFVNGACEHLLLRSDAAGALTLSTLRVWKSPTLAQKVREFFRGWIVPRGVMAHKYPVNPDSPLVYWYYLVRIRDILRRHGRVSMRLLRGNDAHLAAWAEIKENMARWIQS
nr:nucleotidyltransferase family protein [Kiritimatiellia bacterium]